MRRLMILRHAKAERLMAGGSDRDRPLAARGHEDSARLGAYLVRHGLIPDFALVSPATRTRETWDGVSQSFDPSPNADHDDRLYDARVTDLLAIVQRAAPEVNTLMLVGHNPAVHELAFSLTASGDLDARQRLGEAYPTCTLSIIDFPAALWSDLHAQSGRLERFVTPKSLTPATD